MTQSMNRVWDTIAEALEQKFSRVDTDGTDIIVEVEGTETRVRVQLSQELPPPDDNVVELDAEREHRAQPETAQQYAERHGATMPFVRR